MKSIRNDDRGNAMIISVLLLMVISAVGIGFVMQAKTETQIAGNDMRWSQSLFNAEAGISEGMARMSDADDALDYVGQALGTADPGWGTYIVTANGNSTRDPVRADLASDGQDNDLDGDIDEDGESYPELLTSQAAGDPIDYPWVRVEYVEEGGQVLLYGDADNDPNTAQGYNLVSGAPVIRVTAEGMRGNATRTIQVEAVKPEINMVHAAIYAEDDDFQFNGTQFEVSGEDHDPVTSQVIPGNPEFPGIATTMDPQNIENELAANQENNVNGSGADPSVSEALFDLDLEAMLNSYAPMADRTLPAGTYSNVNWGDYDNYEITHVTGDLHGSGGIVGAGLLLVEGDFTCTGQMLWYGLVIVLGDISFSGGGAGIHIFGSVQVQGGVTQQTVGGNADIFYSSEALNRLANLATYELTSWIEF